MADNNIKIGYLPKKGIVEKGAYGLAQKLSLTRREFEDFLLEVSEYPDYNEYEKFGRRYKVTGATIRNIYSLYLCAGRDLDKLDFCPEERKEAKRGKSRFSEETKGIRELPNL